MDKNATANLTYTIKYASGTAQYFAEIGGKYYEITMDGDKITVNEEPTNIGEPSAPPTPTITLNKENIITAEIGENGTITINSNETFDNVEITITCAGKTSTCIVTVVPPPPSAGIPKTPRNTAKEISYNWDELGELADLISSKADIITDDTEEVAVSINGVNDTLRVGDTTKVDGKVVRILGFNHDELSDPQKETAYGGGRTYAGISVEYVDFITDNKVMNSSGYTVSGNSGGWEACELRATLNGTIYNDLLNSKTENSPKGYIKEVKKSYCANYQSATLSYSNDKLWLLSCAEIWNNAYSGCGAGCSKGVEGKQYKYYKKINATYNSGNNALKKPSNVAGTVWCLRSPYYSYYVDFCCVYNAR